MATSAPLEGWNYNPEPQYGLTIPEPTAHFNPVDLRQYFDPSTNNQATTVQPIYTRGGVNVNGAAANESGPTDPVSITFGDFINEAIWEEPQAAAGTRGGLGYYTRVEDSHSLYDPPCIHTPPGDGVEFLSDLGNSVDGLSGQELFTNKCDVYVIVEQLRRQSNDCLVKEVHSIEPSHVNRCPLHCSSLTNRRTSLNPIPDSVGLESKRTLAKAQDGSTYQITFQSNGKTTAVAVPPFDIPGSTIVFVHFPPRTMIAPTVRGMGIGDHSWWRLQGCLGPTKHPKTVGDGQWTARYDTLKSSRRPARIIAHFATCPHRLLEEDPLGRLARAMLLKSVLTGRRLYPNI